MTNDVAETMFVVPDFIFTTELIAAQARSISAYHEICRFNRPLDSLVVVLCGRPPG